MSKRKSEGEKKDRETERETERKRQRKRQRQKEKKRERKRERGGRKRDLITNLRIICTTKFDTMRYEIFLICSYHKQIN